VADIRFLVYSEQDEFGSEIRSRLQSAGHAHVVGVVSDEDALFEALREHQPDALFADLGLCPHDTLDLLDRLPAPRPMLAVCGPQDDSQVILRAMKQGAREFFPPAPSREAVRELVDRLVLESRPAAPSGRLAPVLAVMGAKGGVGATVIACQLAASLQSAGARTAIVDLNLPLGDVALYLDVQPAYTIANIARESERLDGTYLKTLLQGRPLGVQILASPTQAEEAELVRGPHVEHVIELLRQEFDWVIIDVSRTWSEPTVRALDLADQILLVTLMDVPTLHHTRQHIDLLERLGHTGKRIRLIANRYASTDTVSDKDVSDFLDRAPDFRMPNDYPTVVASVNRGVSVAEIAPRSAVARAYAELNQNLHAWSDVDVPVVASRGAFARAVSLFRRS
jgi:pilus assembly protein CpaE